MKIAFFFIENHLILSMHNKGIACNMYFSLMVYSISERLAKPKPTETIPMYSDTAQLALIKP
ncbi:hypothetical protein B9G39_12285 [Zooshikella ganghwensis]|uniref:Uncharacterized protein n=1 Tax=Zooshikella ganghwensis TaxID=202772 RepID=A0A4P9VLI2_9GAMM|nr:hypothetical protein B9G39_12285 [Zooshikella ganghwensis]